MIYQSQKPSDLMLDLTYAVSVIYIDTVAHKVVKRKLTKNILGVYLFY
jgi:hypothetical protein